MTAAAATSDPRATDAAAAVLRAGGNAVDAAVTAAFVLYVVEPQSCGIGGDGFMFVHRGSGRPHALGGSGSVPHGLTSSALAADGLDNVPARGAKTVTPPGAVRLLEDALERYGTIPLATAIAPAHDLARQGFAVRGTLAVAARSAQTNSPDVTNDPVLGPLYWPGGDAVVDGDIVVNHALADALELLAEHGSEAMRTGSLADAIATTVAEHGGYLTREDLAEHETEIITPASIDFAGHTVWQMPAPTQGPAVLAALRDVDASDTIEWAEVVRVMRAAMVEAGFDPAAVTVGTPSPAKGDTDVPRGDGPRRHGCIAHHLGVRRLRVAPRNRRARWPDPQSGDNVPSCCSPTRARQATAHDHSRPRHRTVRRTSRPRRCGGRCHAAPDAGAADHEDAARRP